MYNKINKRSMSASSIKGGYTLHLYLIFILIGFAYLLGITGSHKYSSVLYIAVTLILAVSLVKRPYLYIALIVHLYLFTPFVRRVIDYDLGYSTYNYYGLAPIIASLVSLLIIGKLIANFSQWSVLLPQIIAVIYAYAIGVVNNGFMSATYSLTDWIVPTILAVYVSSNWKQLEIIESSYVRGIKVCMTIIGLYAIIQFLVLPKWDALWMNNVPMTSIGEPLPYRVRVFSTMNSPMILAPVMAGFVFIMFSVRSKIGWVVAGFGTVGILLSLVRSTWGAMAIGFLMLVFLITMNKPKLGIQIGLGGLLLGLIITYSIYLSPMYERIGERIDTLTGIENDVSYSERTKFYKQMAIRAFTNVIGDGLGSVGKSQVLNKTSLSDKTAFDSGLMEIPTVLGLFGGTLYAMSFILLFSRIIKKEIIFNQGLHQGLVIVIIIYLVQLPFANRMIGPAGVFLYISIGLLLAARAKIRQFNLRMQND
ncbi:MAG: hypothetical protein ABW076_06320 [Candidatus Thiodiazotropha sp.]